MGPVLFFMNLMIFVNCTHTDTALQSTHPTSFQNGDVDPAVFVQAFALFIWLMYPFRPHAAAWSASHNVNLWYIYLLTKMLNYCWCFVSFFFFVNNIFLTSIWLNANYSRDTTIWTHFYWGYFFPIECCVEYQLCIPHDSPNTEYLKHRQKKMIPFFQAYLFFRLHSKPW